MDKGTIVLLGKKRYFYPKFVSHNVLQQESVLDMLNEFKVSKKSRLFFKHYFNKSHWFLDWIINTQPDAIAKLVKDNENDLLFVFRKLYKKHFNT